MRHREPTCNHTGSRQRALTTSIIPDSLCWLQNSGRKPFTLYSGRLVQEGSWHRRETTSTIPVSRCSLCGHVDTFEGQINDDPEGRRGGKILGGLARCPEIGNEGLFLFLAVFMTFACFRSKPNLEV